MQNLPTQTQNLVISNDQSLSLSNGNYWWIYITVAT